MPLFSNQDEIEDYGYDWRGEVYDEAEAAQGREASGAWYDGNFSVTTHGDGTYTIGDPALFPDRVVTAGNDDRLLAGYLGIN
jgi:hypothetical protein